MGFVPLYSARFPRGTLFTISLLELVIAGLENAYLIGSHFLRVVVVVVDGGGEE